MVGALAVLGFAGTIGVWSAVATLSGAVIASGQFVVDGNVKKVQHPTGGIVGDLRVRDGDYVTAGQTVLRLDDTITRANLQVIVSQMDELAARRSRLVSERDGLQQIAPDETFAGREAENSVAKLLSSERDLFSARREARDISVAQLHKQIAQLKQEIAGFQSQKSAGSRQSTLIAAELKDVVSLFDRDLVPITRKNRLEREAADLEGSDGKLVASIAQAEGKIAETELQIQQVGDKLREEVTGELREIQGKLAELKERRIAAEDQLARVDLKAPASGYVHQLAVHTVGGVITPAEPALLIVPEKDALQIEAHIEPQDIDQVKPDGVAQVRVRAFNQRTTPELKGRVTRISPDTTTDERTGAARYIVRVALDEGEAAQLGSGHPVTAGMFADVFIKTDDRTPFQYLTRPLMDQLTRAFRER